MAEEVTCNYSGVIKMSVNTNLLAEKIHLFGSLLPTGRMYTEICIYRSGN